MLHGERLGGCEQLVHDGAVLRLQPTSLGGGQALTRESEGGNLIERLAHPFELLFQVGS